MTPQQTKLTLAAAVVAAVLAGSYALNRVADDKHTTAGGDSSEQADADIRQNRLNLGTGGRGDSASSGKGTDKKTANKNASGADSDSDRDLASIVDSVTSEVLPIETEAETRDRKRYEEAMANQFKYRENDPKKIKPTELTPVLSTVSEKYNIPDNLLAAMMYVETGGTHRDGDHSMEAGYGVMNLRENNMVDTLGEAASLIGKSKEDVLYDQATNIEAAAALVRSYYDDALASGVSESEAWYMAISQYSGRPDPQLAGNLADETAGWMLKGFELHLSDGGGDVIVPPNPNPLFLPKDWELVGMTPPTEGSGPQVMPGTIPPDAQGYGATGAAAGGAEVTP